DEWQALARGYYLIHSQAPSVEAYAQAIRLDASLAQDSAVVTAIREMAESSDASEPALILAAQALGSRGADLVYDVWSDAVRDKKKSGLAQQARAVLDGEDVAAHASPALKV